MKESKKAKLAAWLAERAPVRVELGNFEELLRLLAPVKEPDLRRLLRESGAPLAAIVEGVDQSSYTRLRRTLLALSTEYGNGDKRLVRNIVITAKDRAKLAQKHAKQPAEKAEMVLWMLTWLENPEIFPVWIAMRARLLKLD